MDRLNRHPYLTGRLWQRASWLLLLLLLLNLVGSPVAAQQQPFEGLDIVFVIDQSDSMQRISGTATPNDPLGLRFYAPWYAMYWLGEDRLLVHDNITFRMAMVNFGSEVEAWSFGGGRHWQTIDPASRAAWEPVYDELNEQIQGTMRDRFLEETLGATNFLNPFQAAQALFDELPANENRRRVIIVLTDGQPSGPLSGPYIDVDTHMQALQDFAAENFPEPDYLIYVVAMIDASDVYWDNVEGYWEAITNDPCTRTVCPQPELDRAGVVASNDDVGKRFQEILQDLTSDFPIPAGVIVVESEVIPGPLVVPPYLKSLDFTFFKANPAEQLILTDPAENQVSAGQPNVTIEGGGGPIEAVRIANPQPGEWQVGTDPPNTDVDITMRQIFALSRLDSPVRPQVQFLPTTVQYGLLDDLGQPLPFYADPTYRLLVEATLTAGNQSWPVQLTEQPGNVYQADFTPVLTGTHTIFVHAESQDLTGKPIIVFDGEIGTFDVDPAVLVTKQVPTTMQQFDTTRFAFELQDSRGFLIQSSLPVEMVVTVAGEPGAPLTLVAQPDGTYQATYSPRQAGVHSPSVRASVTDNNGTVYEIGSQSLADFTVLPTIRVGLDLVEPGQLTQNDTELWPLNRTPLVVLVEVRDETGALVDPADVFQGNPAEALKLTFTNQDGQDLSDKLQLVPTAQPGVYRAETVDVGRGDYTLRVEAVDTLRPGYLYDNARQVETVQLKRVIHPLHIPIAISAALLLLAASAVTWVSVTRYRRITRHPCVGRLYIVDSASVPLYQLGLDSYNRNHIVVKGGINPLTRINKIEVRCNNDADNSNGRVHIQLWIDKERTPVLDREFGPKGEARIGTQNFWLLKDPTDEQLSRDRFVAAPGGRRWNSTADSE